MDHRISVERTNSHDKGAVVVTIAGEIDLLTSDEFAGHVKDSMVEPNRVVVLDLSEVRFLGSAALSVLVSGAEHAKTQGIDFRLVANERVILRPLEIAGVNQAVAVFDSVAAALDAGTGVD